jgi:hypothetical protein
VIISSFWSRFSEATMVNQRAIFASAEQKLRYHPDSNLFVTVDQKRSSPKDECDEDEQLNQGLTYARIGENLQNQRYHHQVEGSLSDQFSEVKKVVVVSGIGRSIQSETDVRDGRSHDTTEIENDGPVTFPVARQKGCKYKILQTESDDPKGPLQVVHDKPTRPGPSRNDNVSGTCGGLPY